MKKNVILVSGKLRSGKNQFSEYLSKVYKEDLVFCGESSFAISLKDGLRKDCKEIFDYLNQLSEKLSNISSDLYELHPNISEKVKDISLQLKTEKDNFYEEKTKLTRMFLQSYGTEIFRKKVDQDWWVKKLIQRVKESDKEVVLITDVRFPNEIDLLKKEESFNVYTIRINRDMDRADNTNEHDSETALDNYEGWDFVIDNNSTLESLYLHAHRVHNTINSMNAQD